MRIAGEPHPKPEAHTSRTPLAREPRGTRTRRAREVTVARKETKRRGRDVEESEALVEAMNAGNRPEGPAGAKGRPGHGTE